MTQDLEASRRNWTIFERLSRLRSAGCDLGGVATDELARLEARYPDWKAPPGERSDFAIWSESSVGDRGDATDLAEVPTDNVIPSMRAFVEADRWNNDGLWRRFVAAEPQRGFEALVNQGQLGDWRADEWEQLFYHLRDSDERPLQVAVFEFLESNDLEPLGGALHAIARWFEKSFPQLLEHTGEPARLLAMWDKIAALGISAEGNLSQEVSEDPMFSILNEIPGMLTEMLTSELSRRKPGQGGELPEDLKVRFEAAIAWPGDSGLVAQSAMASQLAFLDYVAADWVGRNVVPLLVEDGPRTITRWRARFYHPKLGSIRIFNATKPGFLRTFDVAGDAAREGQVNLLLQAVYQRTRDGRVDLLPAEAKSALARGGKEALRLCARQLLPRQESPEERADHWTKVTKPILQFAYPADSELQSDKSTAHLVDLALAAHTAFPDAVETILPFLRKAWIGDWQFDADFNESGRELLRSFPEPGLALLDAIIPADKGPSSLNELLDILAAADISLEADLRFMRLRGLARRLAS